jgi:hypothetical protein
MWSSSSAWIFLARQQFSVATRTMSSWTSLEIGGRTGPGEKSNEIKLDEY